MSVSPETQALIDAAFTARDKRGAADQDLAHAEAAEADARHQVDEAAAADSAAQADATAARRAAVSALDVELAAEAHIEPPPPPAPPPAPPPPQAVARRKSL